MNNDIWQQKEFEDHIASMLVSMYEGNISGKVRNNSIKAARLTELQLIESRMFGPYIPGKDRRVWEHGFDLKSDLLPKTACVSLAGSAGDSYRHMAYIQRLRELPGGIQGLNAPFFRVSYFMFPNRGKIEGFSAYFDVDDAGRIRLAPMGNFQWDAGSGTEETLSMISQVLQAEADRRFCWQIEAKEKLAHAFLGCQSEQVKSLLYARSLPLTSTGRKRPILHLVEAHRRRMQSGTDIDVRQFLRGIPEIEMGGTLFRVHAPSVLGLVK